VIILDTNVISACMLPSKNQVVVDWLNRQVIEDLWTTTVTLFELQYGIENLAAGTRRSELESAWQELASAVFDDRILAFDSRAARASAELAFRRKARRRIVDVRDTFIAGVAISRSATVATRNTRDFADAGIPLIDPWTATA
jgi:predicted nucleic acid-binding protein